MKTMITGLAALVLSGCAVEGKWAGSGQVVNSGQAVGSLTVNQLVVADCDRDGLVDTYKGSAQWRGSSRETLTCTNELNVIDGAAQSGTYTYGSGIGGYFVGVVSAVSGNVSGVSIGDQCAFSVSRVVGGEPWFVTVSAGNNLAPPLYQRTGETRAGNYNFRLGVTADACRR
jgi:hypothetical protein